MLTWTGLRAAELSFGLNDAVAAADVVVVAVVCC